MVTVGVPGEDVEVKIVTLKALTLVLEGIADGRSLGGIGDGGSLDGTGGGRRSVKILWSLVLLTILECS